MNFYIFSMQGKKHNKNLRVWEAGQKLRLAHYRISSAQHCVGISIWHFVAATEFHSLIMHSVSNCFIFWDLLEMSFNALQLLHVRNSH